jgi:hypothetical protein
LPGKHANKHANNEQPNQTFVGSLNGVEQRTSNMNENLYGARCFSAHPQQESATSTIEFS